MLISPLMGKGILMSVPGGWHAPLGASRSKGFEGLLAHELLLLFSEGSMTLELELLTGRRVDVELKFMGERPLSGEEAAFLGVDSGESALEREVWLVAGGAKLLYAHTLIPLSCMDSEVRKALDADRSEPLGRVLSSKGILFAKERLEAARVRCIEVSSDLSLAPGSSLYARRYILFNKGERDWVIKAAVTEIFSPEVIGGKGAKR